MGTMLDHIPFGNRWAVDGIQTISVLRSIDQRESGPLVVVWKIEYECE